MLILFVVLAGLSIYKIKYASFHKDYMGYDQTASLKGIFAIIIIFSHLRGYMSLSDHFLDTSYETVLNLIGQLMVSIFFFFSGYGIVKSYERKENYQKGFFKNRILKVLMHFDIAVLIYLVLSLILGDYYSWYEYVFSFVGWESIGNSNWFVFVALALYVITYVAFLIAGKINSQHRSKIVVSLVVVMSGILLIVLHYVKHSQYWYDTIFCYSFGMMYGLLKDKIDELLTKSKKFHWCAIIVSGVLFALTYYLTRKFNPLALSYNMCACLFCLFIVMLTTKVRLDNCILRWLGKNSFWIYILQRIPMIVLSRAGVTNAYALALLSIVITLLISYLFGMLVDKIDKKLFKQKAI